MLNSITIKNKYSFSLISELISQLCRAKYFTKLDICWDFNNEQIKPKDEWKATFHTNCGLFKPLVMFFGITNSLAIFQIMMNNIFRDLIVEGIVVVYPDSLLELWKSIHEWSKGYWRFWQSTSMSKQNMEQHHFTMLLSTQEMEYSTRKCMSQFTSTNKNISCTASCSATVTVAVMIFLYRYLIRQVTVWNGFVRRMESSNYSGDK